MVGGASSNSLEREVAASAQRPLRLGEAETHSVTASDGVSLRLTRHTGGAKGPVLIAHCIGVSSRMYTTDTVETNLAEYLYADGFDVWLLDFRLSIDLPASRRQSTMDDVASRDYPAAVSFVREATGSSTVQVVAHGVGSSTFTMAMLSGLEGVRSAVCSQVSAHLRVPLSSRLKSPGPTLMAASRMQTISPSLVPDAGRLARVGGALLQLQPVARSERCDSAVCRRITAIFGPLYEHRQLNAETHAELGNLFGVVNLRALRQLALLSRRGHLVSASGEERYLPHLSRLAIPITYLHGAENVCVLPVSTEITQEILSRANGADLYRRHLIPGYGHVDCMIGSNAAADVYPLITEHLNAT